MNTFHVFVMLHDGQQFDLLTDCRFHDFEWRGEAARRLLTVPTVDRLRGGVHIVGEVVLSSLSLYFGRDEEPRNLGSNSASPPTIDTVDGSVGGVPIDSLVITEGSE